MSYRHLPASRANTTSVASATASTTLLAANTNRKGVMITNTDANALYLKYGADAADDSFTVKIAAGGYWAMPDPVYQGLITGAWAANGAGSAFITEI